MKEEAGMEQQAHKHGSSEAKINPPHYHGDRVMRIIEEFKLGFCDGNVVKYVLRSQEKEGLVDLKKAKWYLEREIANHEKVAYAIPDNPLNPKGTGD